MLQSLQAINWAQLFFTVYAWVVKTSSFTYQQTSKTTRFLVNSMCAENYVFFHGSNTPVYEQNYENRKPGSSKVVCIYNKDTNTIIIDSTRPARTLSFVTAELYHGHICLYTLTSFFDTTYWKGEQYAPSLGVWMGVWSLVNGIHLDTNMDFILRVTTPEGEDNEFNIWSDTFSEKERWNSLNEVTVRLQRLTAPVAVAEPAVAPVPPVVAQNAQYTIEELDMEAVD
jgi:hypothetical protein